MKGHARLVTVPSNAVVILETIEPGVEPEYCVHGQTACIGCGEWLWLGDNTIKVVTDGRAAPICLGCAKEHLPAIPPIDHIADRRRTEGPH